MLWRDLQPVLLVQKTLSYWVADAELQELRPALPLTVTMVNATP